MGQRYLQLNSTATANSDGSATLHVSQMPRNVALFAPGPAYIFVVVNGVPSQGQQIMVGSGKLGAQTVNADQALPASAGFSATPAAASTSAGTAPAASGTARNTNANVKSAAPPSMSPRSGVVALMALVALATMWT